VTSENRLRLVAAVVGITPITAFLMLANRTRPMVPVIISQKVVPNPNGPRLLEINILPPLNLPKPEPDEDFEQVNYRIVDRTGRRFGGQISSLGPAPISVRVATDYGRSPEYPRLEVFIEGQLRGSTDLSPFPEPVNRNLPAKPDPRIIATFGLQSVDVTDPFQTKLPQGQQAVIQFHPVAPLGTNEVWKIQVRETNLSPHPGDDTYLGPKNPQANVAASYTEDIRAVKIHVQRRQRVISSEDITLPPLRLKKFGYQTDFDVPTELKIPNHLGVALILRPRPSSFNDPTKVDRFQTQLALDIPEVRNPPPYVQQDDLGSYTQQDDFGPIVLTGNARRDLARGELISPSIETLGVQSISFLGSFVSRRPSISAKLRNPMPHPVKGPINLKIRVKLLRWKVIDEFDTTIPVTEGKAFPQSSNNPVRSDELRRF
jgi:hypothetical protein